MSDKLYQIKAANLLNCSIQLPSSISKVLQDHKKPNQLVFELIWNDSSLKDSKFKSIYVTWNGLSTKTHSDEEYILIDQSFLQANKLNTGSKVKIKVINKVPKAISVEVIPNTVEDWEILQLNAGFLELEFLNQCRVVKKDQLVTLWTRGNTKITVRIVSVSPDTTTCIFLHEDTEIYVQPLERKKDVESKEDLLKPTSLPNKILRLVDIEQFKSPSDILKLPNEFSVGINPNSILKLEEAERKGIFLNKFPNICILHVITRKSGLPDEPKNTSQSVKQKSQSNTSDNKTNSSLNNVSNTTPSINLNPKALAAHVVWSFKVPLGHIVTTSQIAFNLNTELFSRVLTIFETKGSVIPRQIKIKPLFPSTSKNTEETNKKKVEFLPSIFKGNVESNLISNSWISKAVIDWLKKQKDLNINFVLTHGMLLFLHNTNPINGTGTKLNNTLTVQLDLGIHESTLVNYADIQLKELLKVPFIEDSNPHYIPLSSIKKDISIVNYKSDSLPKLGAVDNIINNIYNSLKCGLTLNDYKSSLGIYSSVGILLCGGKGSGKTSVIKNVENMLARDPSTLIHSVKFDCGTLVNERVSVIIEKFKSIFLEAAWFSPSLICMDGLDLLIPAEMEHMDSYRYRQLAECLSSLIFEFRKSYSGIGILATSLQSQSIHPHLLQSHAFTDTFHLKPPGKIERQKILSAIMECSEIDIVKESLTSIDLVEIASTTEGYLPADLKALTERAVHHSAIRKLRNLKNTSLSATEINSSSNNLINGKKDFIEVKGNSYPLKSSEVMQNNFELSNEDFSSAQLDYTPIPLRGVKLQTSNVKWSDIGGLEETRRVLRETLEWPIKYQSIFANCPLRLRSGLLLYGFPGCGKTMLASAVAKECHLNFITVKGPEILNKYIGASEQSVRDLFERAQAAKPCVLFFDEFEAIAPRRGHDSTGVTDRVVNQLLTQMDGAEGLEGVYVLAATSRPDLIDPALLRPGRLDKSLLCHLPTVQDRYLILKAHANKFHLSEEADKHLENLSERCENFTGADLQALLYNAHLEAIHETLDNITTNNEKEVDESYDSIDIKVTTFKAENDKKESYANSNLTSAEMDKLKTRIKTIQCSNKNNRSFNNFNKHDMNPVETNNNTKKQENGSTAIEIKHIEKALESTNPSLPINEINRLKAIYDEFQFGKSDNSKVGKKVTLG